MGSANTKLIKGHEYLYYVYYENRKKFERYCGPASKPESTKKFLQFDLERLKEQKKNLSQKIIETEAKIKSF